MSNIFFTSDTHYNHKNICRGTSLWNDKTRCRDFETLEEMNEKLISGINGSVGADDILYHLGDIGFGGAKSIHDFLNKTNCKNITLILGNHDMRFKKLFQARVRNVFKRFVLMPKLLGFDCTIYLQHYPYKQEYGRGIHLHGHTHCYNGVKHDGQIDVSVEGNNYKPYSLDEIIALSKS